MAKQIRVTGLLDPEALEPEHVDLAHETGLSEAGYVAMVQRFGLDDLEFELVDDE